MNAQGVAANGDRLSVVVLTYNEEINLAACLASVQPLGCQIVVVDSGSSDQTRAVAAGFGAVVVTHEFETHAKQWQWALNNSPIATEWVLALDADQRLTPELSDEIVARLSGASKPANDEDGFYIKRRQVFRGRWIRYGGYYPKYLLKLFRRSAVMIDERDLVDHHFYVTGRVARLRHDLIEDNQKENDISFWMEKHIRYAELLAKQELAERNGGGARRLITPSVVGNPDQRTLWLKQLWMRLPLYARSCLYFVYRYVVRLGVLDGKQGFIFHFLQAFWFRVVVDIKVDEMRSRKREGADGH